MILILPDDEKEIIMAMLIFRKPEIGFGRNPKEDKTLIMWERARRKVIKALGITKSELRTYLRKRINFTKKLESLPPLNSTSPAIKMALRAKSIMERNKK